MELVKKENIFEKGKTRLFKSLRTRIFFLTALFGLVVGSSAVMIGYTMYSGSTDLIYAQQALRTAQIAAALIDKKDAQIARDAALSVYDGTEKEVDEEKKAGLVVLNGEHKESFANIERTLHEVRDATEGEDQVYYMTYDEDRGHMVFIVDIVDEGDKLGENGDFFFPGTVWLVDPETKELLTNTEGKGYTVYSSGTGMVVSKASPVIGQNGEDLGYIGVDLMLSDVLGTKRAYLISYCLTVGVLVLGLSFLLLRLLSRATVEPIKRLEEGCRDFINRLGTEVVNAPHFFADLDLHTGDEIEKLWLMMADLEVNIAISMRRIKVMTTEKERVDAELSIANQIQSSMLPCTFPAFPDRKEFDLFARMVPAKEVGGDLYDYFLIDEDHLALVIGDVSGKGISAALFMVMTKQLLKTRTMTDGADPVKTITDVNSLLMEDNKARLFVTVFLGILTISTGHFIYVNAGHEYPAVGRRDGGFTIDKDIHSAPVAARKKMVFKQNEMNLEPGDTLYLYTDGIAEAHDREGNMFGKDRLIAALNEDPDASPRDIDDRVRERVREFEQGTEAFDDSTSLCLKYYGH